MTRLEALHNAKKALRTSMRAGVDFARVDRYTLEVAIGALEKLTTRCTGTPKGRRRFNLPMDAIMELYSRGYTYQKIADTYEVSPACIRDRIKERINDK